MRRYRLKRICEKCEDWHEECNKTCPVGLIVADLERVERRIAKEKHDDHVVYAVEKKRSHRKGR